MSGRHSLVALAVGLALAGQAQAQLLITEYLEGAGNNKAVELSNLGSDPVDQLLDGVVVADVAGAELVRQPLDGTARAGHDGRALVGEDLADPGSDAPHPAGDEDDPAGQAQFDGAIDGVSHCASVPSKCLLR